MTSSSQICGNNVRRLVLLLRDTKTKNIHECNANDTDNIEMNESKWYKIISWNKRDDYVREKWSLTMCHIEIVKSIFIFRWMLWSKQHKHHINNNIHICISIEMGILLPQQDLLNSFHDMRTFVMFTVRYSHLWYFLYPMLSSLIDCLVYQHDKYDFQCVSCSRNYLLSTGEILI